MEATKNACVKGEGTVDQFYKQMVKNISLGLYDSW